MRGVNASAMQGGSEREPALEQHAWTSSNASTRDARDETTPFTPRQAVAFIAPEKLLHSLYFEARTSVR